MSDIAARNRNHMPYGITQCYLPPGSGDFPAFTPAKAGTQFSDPGGMQGWVDLRGWLDRDKSPALRVEPWYGHHPSTNRAQCRATLLIWPTSPNRHLYDHGRTDRRTARKHNVSGTYQWVEIYTLNLLVQIIGVNPLVSALGM